MKTYNFKFSLLGFMIEALTCLYLGSMSMQKTEIPLRMCVQASPPCLLGDFGTISTPDMFLLLWDGNSRYSFLNGGKV